MLTDQTNVPTTRAVGTRCLVFAVLLSLFLAISSLSEATCYVSLESTKPTPPNITWATAARVIQDAVDTAAPGHEIVVTWQSVTGVSYFVERATNLAARSPFTLVATNLLAKPGTTSYTDTNMASLTPVFYRAGVMAP
jgi:hypothetical protein